MYNFSLRECWLWKEPVWSLLSLHTMQSFKHHLLSEVITSPLKRIFERKTTSGLPLRLINYRVNAPRANGQNLRKCMKPVISFLQFVKFESQKFSHLHWVIILIIFSCQIFKKKLHFARLRIFNLMGRNRNVIFCNFSFKIIFKWVFPVFFKPFSFYSIYLFLTER